MSMDELFLNNEPAIKISVGADYKEIANWHIILIGVGGTGGYILRSLVRMIHSYQEASRDRFHLTICDGDAVEPHNIRRQDFIETDVHKKKVDVLAQRFSHAYGVSIAKRDAYVEDLDTLKQLCMWPSVLNRSYSDNNRTVIIGAVDNNATRQLLHSYFLEASDIIYIDAGNEGIVDSDKDTDQMSEEEKEAIVQSGYSGQVVFGLKNGSSTILPPVCYVYPDMLKDKETFFPSQSCGREVVNHPQRRVTNEVSAMVAIGYLNNLFADREIVSHMTTFNAQTMTIRPKFITDSYMQSLVS